MLPPYMELDYVRRHESIALTNIRHCFRRYPKITDSVSVQIVDRTSCHRTATGVVMIMSNIGQTEKTPNMQCSDLIYNQNVKTQGHK